MDQELTRVTGKRADPERILQIIGFTIGETIFGVDIMAVHEIVRSAFLTSIPNAPDYVEGLMMLGGNIFPLVDFRKKIFPGQVNKDSVDTRILVLEIEGKFTGIQVDSVTEVFSISRDNIETGPAEQVSPLLNSHYIAGTVSSGNRVVVLPDFKKVLFASDEK